MSADCVPPKYRHFKIKPANTYSLVFIADDGFHAIKNNEGSPDVVQRLTSLPSDKPRQGVTRVTQAVQLPILSLRAVFSACSLFAR